MITAAEVLASQQYIEGAILTAIAVGLFALYERFNFKEIPFDQQQLEDFADGAADRVSDSFSKNLNTENAEGVEVNERLDNKSD